MSAPVIWRALQPCMVAGVYRDAGEVFEAPDTDNYAKDVRVKLDDAELEDNADEEPKAKAKDKPKAKAKDAPGVMPEDLPPPVI